MQRRLTLAHQGLALLSFMAVTGFFIVESDSASTRMFAPAVDDNPQKFRVWVASNSVLHTFNCDPRAADVWLFQTGGGLTAGGHSLIINWPTNVGLHH